jgi:transposase
MILDLHRQGLTVSAIARELGIDRKTVRKCIARGLQAPVYGPRKPRQRVIDPFVACRPYRAKTKGKVERPYRYIREDFFLAAVSTRTGDGLSGPRSELPQLIGDRGIAAPVAALAQLPRPAASRSEPRRGPMARQ